jgi:hypothetical protein
MIASDADFLDAIERKDFINNATVQDELFWFAFNEVSIKRLTMLWLIQQAYDVSFSHLTLEASYLEHATITELLESLAIFHYKPASFVERVLNEGNSNEIERLNIILGGLVNE